MSEVSYTQAPQAGASRPENAGARGAGRSWFVRFAPEILVALAFVAVQVNGVLHMGYAGQDFGVHMLWMMEAAAHPWRFLTENQSQVMLRTNPPLYHLLAAAAAAWGPLSVERNIGVLNLSLGLSGLLLFMATARLWIANSALRAALYLILAFLPVFCIHNLVMAADVLTMPAGAMILLGISRVILHQGRTARSGITLIAVGTGLGLLSKFTFSAVPLLVLGLAGLLSFRQTLPGKRVAWLLVIGAGVPMLLAGGIWLQFHNTLNSHFKGGPRQGTSFHVSDLLLIKSADIDLMEAVPYSRRRDARTRQEDHAPYAEFNPTPQTILSLLEAHRYSYPALLVDGIFTDIMNLRQPGRTGLYLGPRTLKNQNRMDMAIRSGWLLSLLGCFAIAAALRWSASRVWFTTDARSTFTMATLVLAGALAGPIVVAMLYAFDGYLGGYWMPRLILFPLAATLLACFIWLDHLNRRWSRRLGLPLLAIALWQSLLSLSFLVI